MCTIDTDEDAIAEIVRDTLDDVHVDGQPVEWMLIYAPKGQPIEAVNIITSANMSKDRKSDALAVAQQVNDANE